VTALLVCEDGSEAPGLPFAGGDEVGVAVVIEVVGVRVRVVVSSEVVPKLVSEGIATKSTGLFGDRNCLAIGRFGCEVPF